ncbi:MAG: hypothetical protein AAGI08_00060 [Bacteroidota bacterium]
MPRKATSYKRAEELMAGDVLQVVPFCFATVTRVILDETHAEVSLEIETTLPADGIEITMPVERGQIVTIYGEDSTPLPNRANGPVPGPKSPAMATHDGRGVRPST